MMSNERLSTLFPLLLSLFEFVISRDYCIAFVIVIVTVIVIANALEMRHSHIKSRHCIDMSTPRYSICPQAHPCFFRLFLRHRRNLPFSIRHIRGRVNPCWHGGTSNRFALPICPVAYACKAKIELAKSTMLALNDYNHWR